MPDIGGWEWVIIAVVALVLFGGTKLAVVGKNAGRAIREFKEEMATPPVTGPAASADAEPTTQQATPTPDTPAAPPHSTQT